MTAISVIIIIIVLIMLGFCIFFGFKKGPIPSLISFGFNAFAILSAFKITRIISKFLHNGLFQPVFNKMENKLFPDVSHEVFNSGAISEALTAINIIMTSYFIFLIIYIILYFIFKIPKHFIIKKY